MNNANSLTIVIWSIGHLRQKSLCWLLCDNS